MCTAISRGRPLRRLSAAACAVLALSAGTAFAQHSPLVAIVQCEDSYDWGWEDVHSSSQGLVGLAGLVGVPYVTVTLDELLAEAAPAYTSVWFSACPVLEDASYDALDLFLVDHVGAGGSVFLDGPLGIFVPDPMGMYGVSYRGMAELSATLKVSEGGWYPTEGYAVTAGHADHVVARRTGHEPGTPLSQGLLYGTETMDLASLADAQGAILLELTSPGDPLAYPMLVATTLDGGGRVAAIGSYGNYVGGATPFSAEGPGGYFENRVMPYLVETLTWLEHGDGPAVGLQLSHAPMTAIGRLDGDWSGEVEATDETFAYLLELADTTGLATAYGVVSDFVPESGWAQLRELAIELEASGGALGSHSASHDYDMSANLGEGDWAYEVAGSLDVIRAAVSGGGFSPPVKVFINPGGTIASGDYGRFFADVELYMSHGFETTVPYATGVMGFGLPAGVPAVPVVNNTPAPDFQWLYLEEWHYPVTEAAAIQGMLLEYYQHTVQRGVLYNQMWHDYAIGGNLAPIHFPNTPSVLPLFDVNRTHFEANPVYMPSVAELIGKLHIAHKARHSATRDGDRLTVAIDYAGVPARYRPHAAGMGVRIAYAGGAIRAATVDGVDHPAFTDDTLILPAPSGASQTIEVELGQAADQPRLSFSSKPIDTVTRAGDALTVGWERAGLHRKACATGPAGLFVLHADALERTAPQTVCGTVWPGSATTSVSTTVIDSGSSEFFVDRATRPIASATLEGQLVTLAIADGEPGTLTFRSAGPPVRVEVGGSRINAAHQDGRFEVPVPAGPTSVTIVLMACEDADGDGISNCAGDCDDTDPDLGLCEAGGCCSTGADGASSLLLAAAVMLLLTRRRRTRTTGVA